MTSTTSVRAAPAAPARVRAWVVGCAAAEGIGMTAASAAAVTANGLDDSRGLALALVVAGGLVEGTAVGVVQARLLRDVLGSRARAWALVTVAVAGLGWAAASAPATLGSSGDSGSPPPLGLVLAGAAGMGLVMGAALGAAQSATLRGRVRHPWRWVSVGALAWIPTMIVIFAGATAPSSSWRAYATVPLGLLTGLAAGALLGLVSGSLAPTLDGPPPHALVLLGLLRRRAGRRLSRSLLGLRVTGVRTGRLVELPVQYAVQPTADPRGADGDALVVVPLHHERKTWWRNLRLVAPVQVLYDGRWRPAYGRVVLPEDPAHGPALAAYTRRWPRVHVPPGQPLVVLRLL